MDGSGESLGIFDAVVLSLCMAIADLTVRISDWRKQKRRMQDEVSLRNPNSLKEEEGG